MYGIIAILFNPIIPLRLEQETWETIDFVVAAIFILSISMSLNSLSVWFFFVASLSLIAGVRDSEFGYIITGILIIMVVIYLIGYDKGLNKNEQQFTEKISELEKKNDKLLTQITQHYREEHTENNGVKKNIT